MDMAQEDHWMKTYSVCVQLGALHKLCWLSYCWKKAFCKPCNITLFYARKKEQSCAKIV